MKTKLNDHPITMRTSQDKVLAIIANCIAHHKFEPVIRNSFQNRGVISIERTNEFGQLGSIEFDFQNSYFILQLKLGNKYIESQPNRCDYYNYMIEYHNKEQFNKFIIDLQNKVIFPLKEKSV